MIARVMIGMLLAAANPAPAPQRSQWTLPRDLPQRRYAEAVPLLKAEVETDPNNARAYFWLGQCTFELHEFDEAIKYAERAVELDPNKSEYHYVLGKAYGRKPSMRIGFRGCR